MAHKTVEESSNRGSTKNKRRESDQRYLRSDRVLCFFQVERAGVWL